MNSAELTTIKDPELEGNSSAWSDSLGIFASVGCAIHCAAMPFVIAYLPALGLSFLADEAFHKWMALICFLIAIVAFIPGIRKHGNWFPISVGSVGLAFITYAAFGLAGECCPSCSSDSIATTSATQCVECEECEHCKPSEPSVLESSATPTSGSDPSIENQNHAGLLAMLAPWLTPLGGFILVSAHLLNRRFGCNCCGAVQ